jgi:phage shock protein A
MSFVERFITVVKANLNALLGLAEDPALIIDQSLADMTQQFGRAKQAVTQAIADEKKLKTELERETNEVKQWEQRAMLAVQQGRDDLATQALQRQSEHTARADQLHTAWTRQQQGSTQLKQALQGLSDRIEELKRKKNMLKARQHSAEAQQRMHGTLSAMDQSNSIETFQRMEEKIQDMEHRAEAANEVHNELSGASLEAQFKALERGSPDQLLTELKRKMAAEKTG